MLNATNYKLTVAYDGTRYNGWQVQSNSTGIQPLIQEAIRTITRQEIILIGSGRTDAGVHALGQVAHFKSSSQLNTHVMLYSLNGLLPRDIRIISMEEVPLTFHAQHSAVKKTYFYHLSLDPIQLPFRQLYSFHIRYSLDLAAMKAAAAEFLGTHDFTAFANEAHRGSAARNPVRTLYRLDIVSEPGAVRLEFEGSGFLYKMVRNITGILIEVASGKKTPSQVKSILESKDRRLAGAAAPPHGLFLMHVDYDVKTGSKNEE